MEVPDGWLQVIRGPRPQSERWPRWTPQAHQKPAPAVRQPGVQGSKGPRVSAIPATDPVQRASPDTARAAAQEKARKLENALEVMSDVEGPALDALRAELKKVHSAAAVPPLDVQMEQCESFISRSQRRLAELDKQRATEEELLTEAKARLERLRLEAAASSATPNTDSELSRLRAQVMELQRAATPVLPRTAPVWMGDGPPSLDNVPPLPTANIQDVEHWLNCRNCEMRNALEHGDVGTVARCGSLVAQGAAMLANLSHDVPMNARSTLMSALINEGDSKRRCVEGGLQGGQ